MSWLYVVRIKKYHIIPILFINYPHMKYTSIFLIVLLLLGSCWKANISVNNTDKNDDIIWKTDEQSDDKTEIKNPIVENYNIVDVTEWKEIRGIKTSDTKWYVKAAFKNETYTLAWVFENLPKPQNDDFYEGWIIQEDPFMFVSTGKIESKWWMDINTFINSVDYSTYKTYVLTLEPNDWDPAPADHILEWTLEF
jgi:hypothetical protein